MNPQIRNKYEVIIGIETHVQLATKSKLFCGCNNDSRDAEPNTNVCQVCYGLPGALPVLNKRAVELALRLGKALNAEYPDQLHTKFDRKNYFYPDLPKGYQITQFDEPIVPGGYVEFPLGDKIKRVGITRAHLEGDAGKLTHPEKADHSLVDLNRAETPLVEVVSEPDMRSPQEAKGYAQELHNIVRYAGVSDANLYYGNMRFDVNVSVRPVGQAEFGTRTETKNLNSFKAIERAAEYEIRRQIVLVENDEKIRQETRGWNDAKQETYAMRSKEDADEYRYFPEPDLPPLVIPRAMADAAGKFDYLPNDLRTLMAGAKIPSHDIETVVNEPVLAAIFVDTYRQEPSSAKVIVNWLANIPQIFLEAGPEIIDNQALVVLYQMLHQGKVSSTAAKTILQAMAAEGELRGKAPADIAAKLNLLQESNEDELGEVVDRVIADNPQAVADYKAGNQRAFGSLVGASMKATAGKGNPPMINKILKDRLG